MNGPGDGPTDAPPDDAGARAALRLAAGRALAGERLPYLADALYAVTTVATPDVPTVAIDTRWRLYYNPVFVLTCTVDELAGAWLHEVAHPLREHATRFAALAEPADRARLFNQAADAAVNADLRTAGVRLPAVKAWYPEHVPGGSAADTAERLYRLLLQAQPTGRPRQAALTLIPDTLRAGQGPRTVVCLTREAFLGAGTTATATGPGGRPHSQPLTVRDAHGAELTLDTDHPAGPLTVRLTRGARSASATVELTTPGLRLRPDHLPRSRPAAVHLTVVGHDTTFSTGTRVHLHGPDGRALPAPTTVGDVTVVDATHLTLTLTDVPDGLHTLRVRTGEQTLTTALPVARPHLDLTPAAVPSGFAVPLTLTATTTDLPLDRSTTATVRTAGLDLTDAARATVREDPANDPQEGPPGTGALQITLTRPLPDGHHDVLVSTGEDTALAVLRVGGGGGPEGAGQGQDADADPDTDAEDTNDTDDAARRGGPGGPGPEEEQDREQDREQDWEQGQERDRDGGDCGSGAGGPRRAWERDDTGTHPAPGTDAADGAGGGGDDGSVDAGRAELLRRRTAEQVLEHARSHGSVPAGWERWAGDVLTPRVDWRRELHAVTRRAGAHVAGLRDYTYRRPSRRAAAVPGVVLPALRQPRPPRVVEVVDTSGSISDEMLAQVHAETEAVVRRCHGDGVTVIACDAAAARPQRVRTLRELTMTGGGGTDMRAGLAAAAATRPAADLVITMTDGDTPWPAAPPEQNPDARYVVLLLDGDRDTVPEWMHKIVIPEEARDPRPHR
ncbi:DUF2201 family putative metallopeptidase [Kineococcus rhizosphaerae]|uniref:Putative metallopeptidase-like protein n=1 Tax=Kineococcus rhizosphaerae TaxID=559628 RepID=A0A2T0RA98_9ACTN|nr:VWA-like domain-containing protein [Kineococcus rhizosphaerae]PRY18060.1 putative metallopeptidase-like protein [Kineococcus rhizosphaerae]